MIFDLCDGDLSKYEQTQDITVDLALDWLAFKRDKLQADLEMQAALHGAKLRGGVGERASGRAEKNGSLRDLAGMMGGKLGVQRVKVSDEELARRKAFSNQ